MKKEIRVVDEKKGIIQVTFADERWYVRQSQDTATGLPTFEFVPSVTWIAESYPKGVGFYKWLANKGWDEAEALKEAAADKGSKVHQAISDLIDGKEVRIDSKYLNPNSNEEEELTIEEYEAIFSFVDWVKEAKPTILRQNIVVWGDGYAGTIDFICEIDNSIFIVDIKTSQNIWPSHELQVSGYKRALAKTQPEYANCKLAILQLGYRLSKKKWKFTEIEDKYDLFLAAMRIWANEHGDEKPKQIELPIRLKLSGGEK